MEKLSAIRDVRTLYEMHETAVAGDFSFWLVDLFKKKGDMFHIRFEEKLVIRRRLCSDRAAFDLTLPPPLSRPLPYTTQSGLAQRALQRPGHKEAKVLTFVSKDGGTAPLLCFASSGLFALQARVLSSVQPVVL